MSQASQLNIYFVLPTEDKESECSKDMYDAFTCVKQYRGKPQWVLPSFCMSYVPQSNDVFVFDDFEGKAFEKLKKDASKILGAKCMLTCMSAGDSIPPGTSPIYTEGMRGLIVCCTGFDAETRKYLQERIEYMGGVFHPTLRALSSHVVAHNNITPKAIEAFKAKKPVMVKEWVEAVWRRSLEANVRGNDKEFDSYRSPLFHNLKITTSGIAKRKKEQIKDLISQNGGTFTGTLELNITDILIIEAPEGEKYKAAREWKIPCLKSSWVRESVELGKILPLTDHSLKDEPNKASTPKKGELVNFTANFSMVSAIENEERNQTRFEETADVTASQQLAWQGARGNKPVSGVSSSVIDKIVVDAVEAGQFLDGCNVFLSGFNQLQAEKLKRMLNKAGATRFDELTRSVTHVVVAGISSGLVKNSGAHILSIEWLEESVKLRRPAPVEQYLVGATTTAKSTPASPLSKQGARLLSRPEPRKLAHDLEEAANEPPPMEDDLVHRYNLSQQGEPIAERPAQSLSLNPTSFASSRSDMTQPNTELFKGLKFYLSKDLAEEELDGGENLIIRTGGVVVSRKFSGVPDYAIVPIAGATLQDVTALEVVNLLYIKECVIQNQIVPVQYYHQAITWARGSTPLVGCVISVSKYEGSERDFVESVIEILGATVQAILAKRPKNDILKTTHLICTEPSGMKYNGAVRWGLPVVHHNWLLKCAELGIRIPEEPYLISESKINAGINSTNGTNLATPTSSKKGSTSCSGLVRSENYTGLQAHSPIRENTSSGSKLPLLNSDRLENSIDRSIASILRAQSQNGIIQRPLTQEVESKAPTAASHSEIRNIEHDGHTPVTMKPTLSEVAASPRNRALERLKQMDTPKASFSPDGNRTMTPSSPYGAYSGNNNPSPGTRKRLYKWTQQGANIPLDPPAKKQDLSRRDCTPVSELLSRQLGLLMRRPEDQPPDDSPQGSTPRRTNFTQSQSESVKNNIITDLQKMKEIEESYSRTSVPITSPVTMSEEPKVVICAESQPHTEIGWDDPSDRDVALAMLEKAADQILEQAPKIFMFSGLSESLEVAKLLIESSGGKVSSLGYYDRCATHLIAASSMTRAEKLMGSIAAGLWILHPSYLERLTVVKDVYALKEEDYEWGNPQASMPLDVLSNNVRECVINAHFWRRDIQEKKKPPPFSGIKVLLKVSPSKSEVFRRLLEAGGGEVITIDKVQQKQNAFCICETPRPSTVEMENLAKKGIRCVTTLFISDIILRKTTAVEDNLFPGFAEIWKRCQN